MEEKVSSTLFPKVLHPLTLVGLGIISFNLYWIVWLYRRYQEIRQRNPAATEITPLRAAGFMFIPIFNIVWLFIVLADLRRAIGRLRARSGEPDRPPSAFLTPVVGIGHLLLAGAFVAAIGVWRSADPGWLFLHAIATAAPIAKWSLYLPYQVALNSVWTGRQHRLLRAEGSLLLILLAWGSGILLAENGRGLLAAIRGSTFEVALRLEPASSDFLVGDREIDRARTVLEERFENLGITAEVETYRSRSLESSDAHILVRVLQDGAVGEDALNWILDFPPHRLSLQEVVQGPMDQPVSMDDQSLMVLPGRDQEEYFLLRREAIVDGLDIEDARREIDAFGEPVVMVTFSENGAERLEEFTDSHVGEYLAIVLDGVVISAPQVQSRLGRSVMITGGADFSIREAYDLSILIGAARLPFGLASEQIEIINTQQWVWDFGLRSLLFLAVVSLLVFGGYRLGRQ